MIARQEAEEMDVPRSEEAEEQGLKLGRTSRELKLRRAKTWGTRDNDGEDFKEAEAP